MVPTTCVGLGSLAIYGETSRVVLGETIHVLLGAKSDKYFCTAYLFLSPNHFVPGVVFNTIQDHAVRNYQKITEKYIYCALITTIPKIEGTKSTVSKAGLSFTNIMNERTINLVSEVNYPV